MSNALRIGPKAIQPLLERFPDLVNEITTGGATFLCPTRIRNVDDVSIL